MKTGRFLAVLLCVIIATGLLSVGTAAAKPFGMTARKTDGAYRDIEAAKMENSAVRAESSSSVARAFNNGALISWMAITAIMFGVEIRVIKRRREQENEANG